MNNLILILAMFTAHPCDRVDVIELNHVRNDNGTESLCQYVFWQIREVERVSDYHVVDWRIFNHVGSWPRQVGESYRLEWLEGKGRCCVSALVFWESHSNFDPEIRDRDIVPEAKRRKLARPR